MAVRDVVYLIENGNITPKTLMWGGVENEHNATVVKFKIAEKYLQSLGDNLRFRIDFFSPYAGYDPSENLQINDEFTVERLIPQKFTQYGGKMTVTLVITKFENDAVSVEVLSVPSEIYFTPSNRNNEKLIDNLSACEEYFLGLLTRADDILNETKKLNGEIDEKIKEFALKNQLDLSECVKKDQFADCNGNGGILRINPGYGISSGRYGATSPATGDTIIIQTPSNGLIKQRTQKYMPITPSNIDYAVKCALTDPKITWDEEEKAKVRALLGVKGDIQYILTDVTLDSGSFNSFETGDMLIEGQTYYCKYYSSEYPGWFTGNETENPVEQPVEIKRTAEMIEVNGRFFAGFKIGAFSWANGEGVNEVFIYQNDGKIWVKKEFGGTADRITIYTK